MALLTDKQETDLSYLIKKIYPQRMFHNSPFCRKAYLYNILKTSN
ncbi:hypothetical protein C8P68_107104 [Mucilaginibacter yixingensis]|uniref:Uncharacterized protein n=1 Tax=Mucilaginibacter yixingensis TaxID=1295612 RepID=A0A2T5J6E0_9SPHI|nr:hypothetical protein C8P68_107104 [Mucilaginibacter yixingensis]